MASRAPVSYTHLDQIKEILVKDVLEGYSDYAKKNALPDPANLETYFLEYLQSEAGQQVLLKGLSSMIDTSQVEQKFSEAMGTLSLIHI